MNKAQIDQLQVLATNILTEIQTETNELAALRRQLEQDQAEVVRKSSDISQRQKQLLEQVASIRSEREANESALKSAEKVKELNLAESIRLENLKESLTTRENDIVLKENIIKPQLALVEDLKAKQKQILDEWEAIDRQKSLFDEKEKVLEIKTNQLSQKEERYKRIYGDL